MIRDRSATCQIDALQSLMRFFPKPAPDQLVYHPIPWSGIAGAGARYPLRLQPCSAISGGSEVVMVRRVLTGIRYYLINLPKALS
jgi:hypothetical protein